MYRLYKVIQFEKLAASSDEDCRIELPDVTTWCLKMDGTPYARIYAFGAWVENKELWFPISAEEYRRLSLCLLNPNNDEVHYNDNKT